MYPCRRVDVKNDIRVKCKYGDFKNIVDVYLHTSYLFARIKKSQKSAETEKAVSEVFCELNIESYFKKMSQGLSSSNMVLRLIVISKFIVKRQLYTYEFQNIYLYIYI